MRIYSGGTSYLQRYNSARATLIAVVLFTAINIVLNYLDVGYYLVFCAAIPFYIVDFAKGLTGHYPPEFYEQGFEPLPDAVYYAAIAVAAVITLIYLVFWIASSKGRYGWLIAALVFFIVDTVGLYFLYGFDTSMILDYVVHVVIIITMIAGVVNGIKEG